MSRLETITVAWLAQRLADVGADSLVVQFFGGKWLATICRPSGVGPNATGATLGEALDGLIELVSQMPALVPS